MTKYAVRALTCSWCGGDFEGNRAAFCSATCRTRAWNEAHPGRATERVMRWVEENPQRFKATQEQRRARLENAPGDGVTPDQWIEILSWAGRACVYCGSSESLAMDHVTPIARGGRHDVDNVVPACKSCNSSKWAHFVSDWLPIWQAPSWIRIPQHV